MDGFGRTACLKRVRDPRQANDAVNKRYVDANSIPRTKDGDYNFQGRKLTNVKHPLHSSDAATKHYVDLFRIQRYKNGDFDVDNKRILNVADPVGDKDACTKGYVKRNAAMLDKTKMLNMNNKRVKYLAEPIEKTDATTKNYVDSKLAIALTQVPSVYTFQLMSKPPHDKIIRTYTFLSGEQVHTFHHKGFMKVIHHVPDVHHLKMQLNGKEVPFQKLAINSGDKLSFHLTLSVSEVRAGKTINDFPLYVELEITAVTT